MYVSPCALKKKLHTSGRRGLVVVAPAATPNVEIIHSEIQYVPVNGNRVASNTSDRHIVVDSASIPCVIVGHRTVEVEVIDDVHGNIIEWN